MTEHILKVAAPYYRAVVSGEKTFEVRRNDRSFQRGDTLLLLDAANCNCDSPGCARRANGGVYRTKVTYVYAGDPRFYGHGGMQPGFVVLGLGKVRQ